MKPLFTEAAYLVAGLVGFLAFCVLFYLVLSAQLEITSWLLELY